MTDTPATAGMRLSGTDGVRLYAFALEPGTYVLGRRDECDFCVPHRTISRRHAEIEVTPDGRCFVRDLGSHNGTQLDGAPVTARTEVSPGMCLTFGGVEFRLESGASAARTRHAVTRLAESVPENSVCLSINEALQPLPPRVTDTPEIFPALSELAKMLVLPEPKEVMLERALALVARVIPAERLAVLFTASDAGDQDVYAAATLLPGGRDPGDFTLSRTIITDILTNRNAILIGDPQSDDRFADRQSIMAMNLKSAMAVPLFDEGQVLGILYVDSTNPAHRYTDDYLRLLAVFGNIIAARLLNYELLQERQEKQVIAAELARASRIQANLLPGELPQPSGYQVYAFQEQCRAVGGDLYDVVTLADGRLLFLVADVSGKGMGAALLMSNILASFRILYARPDFDLVDAVTEVSRQLYRYSEPGDFATLFAGVIDPQEHRLQYVNAGHNPAVLCRADGDRALLEASGTMIGAFDFMAWSEQTVPLSPGDLVCVFTDGVTEAETENGDQYGDTRLLETLLSCREQSAAEVAARVRDDVVRFVDGAPRSDDLTLLVVKRE